jgi:cell division topological specificity factor
MIMSILGFLSFWKRDKSANVAKERLMLVLSYERKDLPSDFTERVRKDLIKIFEKYPQFNLKDIEVNLKTGLSRDELSICIPFRKDRR